MHDVIEQKKSPTTGWANFLALEPHLGIELYHLVERNF